MSPYHLQSHTGVSLHCVPPGQTKCGHCAPSLNWDCPCRLMTMYHCTGQDSYMGHSSLRPHFGITLAGAGEPRRGLRRVDSLPVCWMCRLGCGALTWRLVCVRVDALLWTGCIFPWFRWMRTAILFIYIPGLEGCHNSISWPWFYGGGTWNICWPGEPKKTQNQLLVVSSVKQDVSDNEPLYSNLCPTVSAPSHSFSLQCFVAGWCEMHIMPLTMIPNVAALLHCVALSWHSRPDALSRLRHHSMQWSATSLTPQTHTHQILMTCLSRPGSTGCSPPSSRANSALPGPARLGPALRQACWEDYVPPRSRLA